VWQRSLFDTPDPCVDDDFVALSRLELDDTSWVDHAPGWLAGHETVFDRVTTSGDPGLVWHQREVSMFERRLPEPRLTAWWSTAVGPEPLPVLAGARQALTSRYGEPFDSIGFNWYRDGEDSVAWHGDRHRHHITNPVVAIVSVGAARPFRLRPRGGGASHTFELGHGDLLVMGGACQHDWEHTVPKVRHAGPRVSITYRHGRLGDEWDRIARVFGPSRAAR
jgi:hypothetical protein